MAGDIQPEQGGAEQIKKKEGGCCRSSTYVCPFSSFFCRLGAMMFFASLPWILFFFITRDKRPPTAERASSFLYFVKYARCSVIHS
jgi:hypothetical protein